MKNWAQNKKNPANRIRDGLDDSYGYGDLTTAIGYISTLSALKKEAERQRKEREIINSEVSDE